jgi:hypothetical protein
MIYDIEVENKYNGKRLSLARNTTAIKWLKNNWEHYDEYSMHLEKVEKANILFISINNSIIRFKINTYISEEALFRGLKKIENVREFKLKKIIEHIDD